MIWTWIFIAGIITFLTRYSMIALIKPKTLNETARKALTYVPSAVFPAIIFPAVFLDKQGDFIYILSPQILAFFVAVIVGYLSKNVILTIASGLISFWIFSYVLY